MTGFQNSFTAGKSIKISNKLPSSVRLPVYWGLIVIISTVISHIHVGFYLLMSMVVTLAVTVLVLCNFFVSIPLLIVMHFIANSCLVILSKIVSQF